MDSSGKNVNNLLHKCLEGIFTSFTSLVPVKEIYSKVCGEPEYMKWILSIYCQQYSRCNSLVDPKEILLDLLSSENLNESFIKIVTVKTILSFCELTNGQYEQAYKGLNWLSSLISLFESSYVKSQKDQVLPSDQKNSIALLFARSSTVYDGVTLADLNFHASRILNHSLGFDISQEHLTGKLEYFFLTMGFLLQKRSILSSESVSPGIIKLNQDDLEEMIRNFIVVSNLLPFDDCNITRIYDDILTAILFHGYFHIKVLWCFKFLRDYLTLEVQLCSPFCSDYVSEFSSFSKANESSNLIIKKIMKTEKLVAKNEMQTAVIEDRFTSSFLIPEIVATIKDNQLVNMVFSSIIEPSLEYEDTIRYQEKSEELIKLWIDSFCDYKGELPKEIYNYFKKMGIIT